MSLLVKGPVKTCEELLQEFNNKTMEIGPAKNIEFVGVGNKDVYNITAPFLDNGELVIAGRVEDRDSEESSVYFFVERAGKWEPKQDAPTFRLQDPFLTFIKGDLVLGGVETFPHPEVVGALGWRTIFLKGSSINELKEFAKGPDGMKDVRLVELSTGDIGVFTRPQGEKGGRGKIGFTRIDTLANLTSEKIDKAPLLVDQFIDEEWGGANEIHLLENGLLGVLGHIANFDKEGDRHYYPMIFVYNPLDDSYSDIELIATRSKFLEGPYKRPDLIDVVFSGGLIRKG